MGKMLSIPKKVRYIHEPFNVEYCSAALHLPLKYWYSYLPDLEEKERFDRAYHDILTFRSYPDYPDSDGWPKRLRGQVKDRLRGVKNRSCGKIPLVKDPLALLSAEHLAEKFDLEVVCMIRHPLAFCSSIKKWNWEFSFGDFIQQPKLMESVFPDYQSSIQQFADEKRGIVEQAALLWNVFHHAIKCYQERNPEWVFLRHEDVVENPLATFEQLYQKLNLEFSEECKLAVRGSGNSGKGEVESPAFRSRDHRAVVETWKERLTESEITYILEETEELRGHFYPG